MTENKRARHFYLGTNNWYSEDDYKYLKHITPMKFIHVIEFSEVESAETKLAAANLKIAELEAKISNYELELSTPDCRLAELEQQNE